MNRAVLVILLSVSAALLATLVIVPLTAPPPSTQFVAPAGARHHASQE
ncbi:hypothetical protein [Burkholderia ubonensis]|nr:hypothetical protein [Burkholderia ubonensis]